MRGTEDQGSHASITADTRTVPKATSWQHAKRDEDCVANVYQLAVEALHKEQWNNVLYFDSLSRSQLDGVVRPGRPAAVSLIITQISPPQPSSSESDNVTPRRSSLINAKRVYIPEINDVVDGKSICNIEFDEKIKNRTDPQSWYDQGMMLFDPQRPLFNRSFPTAEDQARGRNQADDALHTMRSAPREIMDMIMQAHCVETNIDEMTTAPARPSEDPEELQVHMLISMKSDDLTSLEGRLNDMLSHSENNSHCKLHAWRAIHPASRYDTWRLFERFCYYNRKQTYSTFAFIGWAPTDGNVDVGIMQWNYNVPPLVRKTSLQEAMDLWKANMKRDFKPPPDSADLYDKNVELLLDYDAPFYWDPPPFISLKKETFDIPVFLLTKHLTQEEFSAVREEIETMGEVDSAFGEGKGCILVEWDREEDGTLDDMWRLTWQCHAYRGQGSTGSVVFIDRQSAVDLTVTVTDLL